VTGVTLGPEIFGYDKYLSCTSNRADLRMTGMANSGTATPPARAGLAPGRPQTVAAVTESFTSLQRTVRRAKARLVAVAGDDVDSATQLVLHTVGAEGPMRASALAASVQSDLSTVSRQAAALVSRGLLQRQADQHDGRASLLAVTEAGRVAIDRHEQGRQAFFEAVLSGWTSEEMRQFAQQLERFTAAYEHTHTIYMNEREQRTAAPSPNQEEGPEA
jgi:DNA-binding MarR family transcriptional regulator